MEQRVEARGLQGGRVVFDEGMRLPLNVFGVQDWMTQLVS